MGIPDQSWVVRGEMAQTSDSHLKWRTVCGNDSLTNVVYANLRYLGSEMFSVENVELYTFGVRVLRAEKQLPFRPL